MTAGSHLRLSVLSTPANPGALLSVSGNLGGLAVPRGIGTAPDGGIYLLAGEAIFRLDREHGAFVRLPAIGGTGADAREFQDPVNIAAGSRCLYVADRGNATVKVFDRGSLALLSVFEGLAPSDVHADGSSAWILERRRLFLHRAGRDSLHLILETPDASIEWTRIARDRQGNLYLLDERRGRLDIFDAKGCPSEPLAHAFDPGEVAGRFSLPAVTADNHGRIRIGSLAFFRDGSTAIVDPAEPAGPPQFASSGYWISEPVDSEIPACPWDRIMLSLVDVPAGSRVSVSTFAAETPQPNAFEWSKPASMAGSMRNGETGQAVLDSLVQADSGRYLWLRIQLAADGFATPIVESARIHFPRQSYLEYLPAVYRSDEPSRRFLENFLGIMQREWDSLEERFSTSARLFDPRSAPEPFLDYLAAWLGLELEASWTAEQKRHLLAGFPQVAGRIGTLSGAREFLCIYLEALSGERSVDAPVIIEGFRERDRIMSGVDHPNTLGAAVPLWGPSAVGRLRVGVHSTLGQARIVSTGDPSTEIFRDYAHRFTIFIPSALVRSGEQERMLRSAIELVTPAHASYELCLVRPRFRVGTQSTVGVDTILGAIPLPGAGRVLGSDSVVGGIETPAMRLAGPMRIGLESNLI